MWGLILKLWFFPEGARVQSSINKNLVFHEKYKNCVEQWGTPSKSTLNIKWPKYGQTTRTLLSALIFIKYIFKIIIQLLYGGCSNCWTAHTQGGGRSKWTSFQGTVAQNINNQSLFYAAVLREEKRLNRKNRLFSFSNSSQGFDITAKCVQ